MRKLILVTAATVAACSDQNRQSRTRELKTYDVQEALPAQEPAPPPPVAMPAPPPVAGTSSAEQAREPNIAVTAAPGVAFNYRYSFRLPDASIAAAQETHASMCEKLGPARCRISGMRYSLVNERDVSASLELKLDPALARQFGKDATKVITDTKGMLVDEQISGGDARSSIEHANSSRAELQDELDRVNRELARPGLSNVVRDRLLSEAESLRAQMRALGEQKKADEESLATTPMVFNYGSGETIPGFDQPRPLQSAFDRAGYNFLTAIGLLVIMVATLLPWLLLAALVVWTYRRLPERWRFFHRSRGDESPAA